MSQANFNIIKLNTHNPEALSRAWRLGLSEFGVDYDIAFQNYLDKLTQEYKDYKLTYIDFRQHGYKKIKELEQRIERITRNHKRRIINYEKRLGHHKE